MMLNGGTYNGKRLISRATIELMTTVRTGDLPVFWGNGLWTTDDLGFRAVENPVSVADFHATILHLLGFDHTKLFYDVDGNREKLTSNFPVRVVNEILA